MISKRKRIIFTLVVLLFPLFLMFLGFELTLRINAAGAKSTEARRVVDPVLGWRPTPNLVREGVSIDAMGQKSTFRMTQNEHGFRRWGDPATNKPRVLVIGDSYTQSDDIDDQKTYFARLASGLAQAEFWAFGCSGYGTFQHLLVLQQYQSLIKPDVLVLQLSSNDVVNNLAELEDCMPFLATPAARPYLQNDGTVKYQMTQRHRGIAAYSRAIASLSDRVDSLLLEEEEWVPGKMRKQTIRFKSHDFDQIPDRAIVKTADLLKQIQSSVGPDTQIIAFYDEDVEILTSALKQACLLAGVNLIDDAGKAIITEEGRRGCFFYRTRDFWHWNDEGHAVVAGVLEPYVRKALENVKNDSSSPATQPEKIAVENQKMNIKK
ncbi:MAG: SGNH/GDSL hydrolase family protein [bacterium]